MRNEETVFMIAGCDWVSIHGSEKEEEAHNYIIYLFYNLKPTNIHFLCNDYNIFFSI